MYTQETMEADRGESVSIHFGVYNTGKYLQGFGMPQGFGCFFPPVLGFTMLQLLRGSYAVAELHSCSLFKKSYRKNKIFF